MADLASKILGKIGSIQTLIENFPMGILDAYGGKTYTSIADFVIDALKEVGIDDRVIVQKLIELVFGVANVNEIYGRVSNYYYKKINKPEDYQKESAVFLPEVPKDENVTFNSPDYIYTEEVTDETYIDDEGYQVNVIIETYYQKKSPYVSDELNSTFLVELESSCKSVIMNILTAIFSCSINPELKNLMMDSSPEGDLKPIPEGVSSGFTVPISIIDPYGLLNYCPTNDVGKNFYNVDDNLTVNTLYKSQDLNAFIWYVMNRGISEIQVEKNKMMWDSRITDSNQGNPYRKDVQTWNYWLNSKKVDYNVNLSENTPDDKWPMLTPSGFSHTDITRFYNSGMTMMMYLHPIMQLERYDNDDEFEERKLYVKLSSQSYYTPNKNFDSTLSVFDPTNYNKTIFDFNKDYLENIRIFVPRIILSHLIEALIHGKISILDTLLRSEEENIIDQKLEAIINGVLEETDYVSSDCYFSFSNDDYIEMMQKTELDKYSATYTGGDKSLAIKYNKEELLNRLDSVNSKATMNEKISEITKTVYDIAAVPSNDSSVLASDGSIPMANSQWLNRIISAIMKPMVKALLTPQVMLLFIINFESAGLIKLDGDFEKIMQIIYKKILSLFVGLARYIRDKIIEFLLKLFAEKITPMLVLWSARINLEAIEDWIRLLQEAIACIPRFSLNNNALTEIDDVHYADIVKNQDTPETSQTC